MGHDLLVCYCRLACNQCRVSLCCPLLFFLTNLCSFVCQASHAEGEQALQRRLEEVCEELRAAQSNNSTLQASMEKAQQDSSTVSGQGS